MEQCSLCSWDGKCWHQGDLQGQLLFNLQVSLPPRSPWPPHLSFETMGPSPSVALSSPPCPSHHFRSWNDPHSSPLVSLPAPITANPSCPFSSQSLPFLAQWAHQVGMPGMGGRSQVR